MGLQTIDPRHRILRKPTISHESRTAVYEVLGHPYQYRVNVHTDCVCNEYIALTNRHLVDRTNVRFDKKLWASISRATRKFYPRNLEPCSYEDIIKDYSGKKKRAYHNAAVLLRKEGLNKKHWQVSMFVKPDRYPEGDCETKDPRAIQFRSPEFNLAFGAYIKPFEHAIYPSVTYASVSGTRVIAKGLNNYERAELLLHKIDYFTNPVFVLLDHSRFDSTINQDHLRSTHVKYERAFRSRRLAWLCKRQMVNNGTSKHGIKYIARGTRMSGDADTGCGNSVVNGDCLWGFLNHSGITKYDFLLDGDDSVVIVEKCDVGKLDFSLFERMGFNTKHQVVGELSEVEFCQAKIVLAERVVFSRNPTRAMSHAAVSRKKYPRCAWSKWVGAVGMCEAAMNRGVPVLERFGVSLSRLTTKPLVDDDLRHRWDMYQPTIRDACEVSADARESFALAWGISPQLQVLLESYDYTALAYKSEVPLRKFASTQLMRNEQARLDQLTWRISGAIQSAPEFSGCCWWSSCQTRFERPGPGCL